MNRKLPMFTLTMTLLLALPGCVPVESLHPFWSPEDVVFEPALLGTWVAEEKGENMVLRFEDAGKNVYRVSFFSSRPAKEIKSVKGWALEFEGHLIRLGGSDYFLDLIPSRVTFKEKEIFDADVFVFVRPVHTLHKIRWEGQALGLDYLDDYWLRNKLREKNLNIPLEELSPGHDYILTAGTKQLRELMQKLAPEMEPIAELPFRRKK